MTILPTTAASFTHSLESAEDTLKGFANLKDPEQLVANSRTLYASYRTRDNTLPNMLRTIFAPILPETKLSLDSSCDGVSTVEDLIKRANDDIFAPRNLSRLAENLAILLRDAGETGIQFLKNVGAQLGLTVERKTK